jgi:hypothetical protein
VRPSAAAPAGIRHTVTRRRILFLVALASGALATPTDASARTGRLHTAIALPAPGHITVAALRMNATGDPARLPQRARLRLRNAAKLPPSVKVLVATRSIATKHGRRYAAAIFVVRRADAQAYSAAAPPPPGNLDLLMWMSEREAEWTSQVVAIRNADKAKRRARKTSTLGDLFLEVAAAIDLNGDGAIGVRQQIDTSVGPIVIT